MSAIKAIYLKKKHFNHSYTDIKFCPCAQAARECFGQGANKIYCCIDAISIDYKEYIFKSPYTPAQYDEDLARLHMFKDEDVVRIIFLEDGSARINIFKYL